MAIRTEMPGVTPWASWQNYCPKSISPFWQAARYSSRHSLLPTYSSPMKPIFLSWSSWCHGQSSRPFGGKAMGANQGVLGSGVRSPPCQSEGSRTYEALWCWFIVRYCHISGYFLFTIIIPRHAVIRTRAKWYGVAQSFKFLLPYALQCSLQPVQWQKSLISYKTSIFHVKKTRV